MKCPLCLQPESILFSEFTEKMFKKPLYRKYYRCQECSLIFLDPALRLERACEKDRYDVHENTLENQGYKKFLEKLWLPFKTYIEPGSKGVDFGSGPHPALVELAALDNIDMDPYDLIYSPIELKNNTYDFMTSTEVVEHFYDPASEFETWSQILKPGAIVGVMTEFYTEGMDFKAWRYRHDDTHVCFYCEKTLKWLCDKYNWEILLMSSPVVIFKV